MESITTYFNGKTAVVTGAASGVGLALIEELLANGASKVVLADFNRDNLAKNEQRLGEAYPSRVKALFCDVTKEENVQSMIDQAAEFFGGKLDLLINCAGAAFNGLFADSFGLSKEHMEKTKTRVQTNEDWEKAFALNFYGPLYGCRAAIPIMMKQKSGQIVNIISGIAFLPMPYQTMYAATKSALNGLTLSLRGEYWDQGIKFNSATPGTTATAIFGDPSKVPSFAQSPQDSARHILAGVAENRRIILGDEDDVKCAKISFNPDMQDEVDKYVAQVLKARRSGTILVDPKEDLLDK